MLCSFCWTNISAPLSSKMYFVFYFDGLPWIPIHFYVYMIWNSFTFTFMHLADAFIQSDKNIYYSQIIAKYSGYKLFFFCQYMWSLGIEPTTFALLTTEPQEHFILLKWNETVKRSWSDSQSSSGDVVRVFLSSLRRCALQCVCVCVCVC